jgi:quercetin dioxygenase-like cupin family protein
MTPVAAGSTCVVPPSEGRVYRAFGDEITVHLGGRETGGKYTMFTISAPPGSGPPPHCHLNEDEWFFVLEGRAEFYKDNQWTEVPVGTSVFTPRGVIHSFRNAGDAPLRMIVQTSPAGFEDFFSRCADEFSKSGGPDMSRVMQIAADHGIQFVPSASAS